MFRIGRSREDQRALDSYLGREQLRVRDFVIEIQSARANQRCFGGKRVISSSF